jgi:repressor of nif and glnA expression
MIGLATICSVTIEGILLNNKLLVNPLYGGLIEFINQKPHRFTDVLLYGGSSFDPLDLFISKRMGTVYNAVVGDQGEVLADYREVHCIFREKAVEILKKTVDILGGLIIVGRPGSAVLGLPSTENHFGIIGFGGELLLSALEERKIQTNTRTVSALVNLRELKPISPVKGEVLLL